MRSRLILVAASLGLTGCGLPIPFVNFSAKLAIRSVEPATVTVSYAKGTSNEVTASFKNPVVTLEGAPGSPGATFNAMELRALDPADPSKKLGLFGGAQKASVPISLRVAPSTLREDPRAGTVSPVGQDQQKLVLGQGKAELPIVSNGVLEYGKTRANGPLTVSAVLKGTDDALWPVAVEVLVPVAFAGGN